METKDYPLGFKQYEQYQTKKERGVKQNDTRTTRKTDIYNTRYGNLSIPTNQKRNSLFKETFRTDLNRLYTYRIRRKPKW